MTDLIEVKQSTKRVYISGPMTGFPDFNYPAFNAAAADLRAAGVHVENPAENPKPPCGTWLGFMRLAVAQISHCDYVVTLPGWAESRGARVEVELAQGLGLPVKPLPEFIRIIELWS
ncbi:DUF4406 domain-containing protein [Pseudomonas mosselii]|uniref:DUF4406 domain-containing protein n=1 Tax=Pseudomonas mosselii TaxID=78327 RepID=UPI002022F353|nr:DUF4406 domain-containing protein [Pseudomonas mosselii]MCL8299427.1 DUF4406 domain-containing protein [Pseudomonas mosselii]MCL8339716.1 DUF4406 domain-containing protein [Pseudomonas mosselii]